MVESTKVVCRNPTILSAITLAVFCSHPNYSILPFLWYTNAHSENHSLHYLLILTACVYLLEPSAYILFCENTSTKNDFKGSLCVHSFEAMV
jgi:hypothetical protein